MEKRKEKKELRNLKDLEIEDNNPARMKFVDLYNERWEEKFDEAGYFQYQNRFDDVHIISKKMGFIGWLVEKQKIDVEIFATHPVLNRLHERYFSEDCLIMYLSVQDNPISFLLSILR